jgi:hypothetical protein
MKISNEDLEQAVLEYAKENRIPITNTYFDISLAVFSSWVAEKNKLKAEQTKASQLTKEERFGIAAKPYQALIDATNNSKPFVSIADMLNKVSSNRIHNDMKYFCKLKNFGWNSYKILLYHYYYHDKEKLSTYIKNSRLAYQWINTRRAIKKAEAANELQGH